MDDYKVDIDNFEKQKHDSKSLLYLYILASLLEWRRWKRSTQSNRKVKNTNYKNQMNGSQLVFN